MATINIGTTATSQLNAGASILAAARTADPRLIKERLAAFERAQRAYVASQDKVNAAEARLAAAQTQLGELDADQDDAVDALARALVADGQSLKNPFAAVGSFTPRQLMAQAVAEEAKAIHQLAAAIQRAKGLSKASLQAAQAADKAAGAVEQQLAQMTKLLDALRQARHERDAAAQTWAAQLASLKRGARAAADDGAPGLYATLFDRPARTNGNGKSPKPTPAPAPSPTTTQTVNSAA
jgi:hypothetical protein